MSYGRAPFYIYEGKDDFTVHFPVTGLGTEHRSLSIPSDAIAQLIYSIAWRGSHDLQEWVDRGQKLRETSDGCPYEHVRVDVSKARKPVSEVPVNLTRMDPIRYPPGTHITTDPVTEDEIGRMK